MKRVLEIQKAMKTLKGEIQGDGAQRGQRHPSLSACLKPRTKGLRDAGSVERGAKSESQLSIGFGDNPENP
jgi:hypothetical protein